MTIKQHCCNIVVMEDWKSKRLFKNDKLIPHSLYNAILYIDNLYAGIFGYDIDDDSIYLVHQPPWHLKSIFVPHLCEDVDFINMVAELEQYGLRLTILSVERAVRVIAEKIPFKPEKPRVKYNMENIRRAPPGWYDIINEATRGHEFAYPKDLIKVVQPDVNKQDRKSYRKVTMILHKLGFNCVQLWINRKAQYRWKRVLTPDSTDLT